jgi:myo-inositol 2-dehydrogenase/D-chiro-inositol 1-dehydrogenase
MSFLKQAAQRFSKARRARFDTRAMFSTKAWDSSSPSEIRWATSCSNWIVNDQGGKMPDVNLEDILNDAAGAGYSGLRLKDAGVGMTTATGKPKSRDDFFKPDGRELMQKRGFVVTDNPVVIDLAEELANSTLMRFDEACQQLSPHNFEGTFAPVVVVQDMPETRTGTVEYIEEELTGDNTTTSYPYKPFKLPRSISDNDFENICSNLTFLQERAMEKFNIEVLFHPKSDGRISKPEEIKELLSKTTLSYVFDTGHLVWSSERTVDLVTLAKETKERIGVFHFKDIDPLMMHESFERGWSWRYAVSQGMIPKLGAGLIHFKKLLEWMVSEKYKGFVLVRRSSHTDPKSVKDLSLMQRRVVSLMMDKRVKTALVGVGRMGLVHLRHAFSNPRFQMTHVLDSNEEHGQNIADEFRLKYAHNLESIADHIDAVICVTPTKSHKHYVEQCAQLGLHILVEKPVAEKTEEIEECFDICANANVTLVSGFQRRFDPMWRLFKNEVKELGAPIEAFRMVDGDHPMPPLSFLKSGGGIFMDLAQHDFDQLQWIFQEPIKTVQASVSTFSPAVKAAQTSQSLLEDSCVISLVMESGALATIHATRRSKTYDQRMEVFTEKGTLSTGHDPNDPVIPEKYNSCLDRYRESYYNLLNHFADRILFNVIPEVTKEEIIANTVIADLCEQSVRAGGLPMEFPKKYVPNFPPRRKVKAKKY